MVSLALPGPVGAAPAGAARPRIAALNPPATTDVNVAALAAPVVNVAALAAPLANVAALAAPVANPNFFIVWAPSFCLLLLFRTLRSCFVEPTRSPLSFHWRNLIDGW